MALALSMRGISKAFPGVQANDQIDFDLERGEIHVLLGENGAGKTTLMNILYGLYRADAGQIYLNGREVHIATPSDAIAQGIGMVHQHFMLVPVFTVTENTMLGVESTRYGLFLRQEEAAQRIRDISEEYGLEVEPEAYIKDIPVGVQQRVEIIKALYRQADILILDEPTSVLTPQEAEELFQVMRSLVDEGKSIIFITHKLKEVFAVADRITVLRDGHVVGTTTPGKATEAMLAEMMVGREVILTVEKEAPEVGEIVLEVEDLWVLDDRGLPVVNGVSLQAKAGEILGIAGVQGNGQTELVEALTGLRSTARGRVRILGTDTTHASPREILEKGVGHIPEDRHKHGMVLSYPIADNLVLSTYYQAPFAHGMVIDGEAIDDNGRKLIAEFDIRTPSEYALAGTLSGGNQQKLIVAREFSRPIKLLISAQPTRGLDVGSIEFIHQKLIERRDAGTAILLVSVELDEVMALSDRIAVIYEGEIVETLPIAEATREGLGLLMAGARKEGAIAR